MFTAMEISKKNQERYMRKKRINMNRTKQTIKFKFKQPINKNKCQTEKGKQNKQINNYI